MFFLGVFPLRLVWLCFLFVSFWPWEQEPDRIKKSSLEIPSSSELLKILRVALFYELPEVHVGILGPYQIKGLPKSDSLLQGPSLPSLRVRPDPGGIRLGATLYAVSGLHITSKMKAVQIENRKYHNAIQVLRNPKGTLTVVNEIDVEDYLKGVLPVESRPEWPEEALKAQAVVSRTYAIFKNIENKDFPFTLSSDVASQVYGGETVERASTNRAVERTRGEILTSRGKIFPTFFHSTCGGRTGRADYQWKIEPHPSLKGVECPFCRDSKYDTWKAEFSLSEIQNILAKKGHSLSPLQNILPDSFDPSGRPRFFILQQAQGSLTLPANELRLALHPDRMRSTKVEIERRGERFLFRGRGWGHGVGMCQFGAKRLAELGYRYRDILRYYYPESELRPVDDFLIAGRIQAPSEGEGEGNLFKRWYQKLKSYVEDL